MAAEHAGDGWTRLAMGVFRLNSLLIQAGEGITGPIGQSSARWQVLGRAVPARTVADIAREIGHARQGVQRIADVLAGEGLVRYRAHPTDRRTKLVELTPDGLRVLQEIYQRQGAWSERVTAQLEPERLAALTAELAHLSEVVEGQIDEPPTD